MLLLSAVLLFVPEYPLDLFLGQGGHRVAGNCRVTREVKAEVNDWSQSGMGMGGGGGPEGMEETGEQRGDPRAEKRQRGERPERVERTLC